MILTPTQSIIFKDIPADRRKEFDDILKEHGIPLIENVDNLTRLSIACPALPLCGLAVTEAERRMPEWVANTNKLLHKLNIKDEKLIMRMTGCPNGCARPYMAELSLVGDGPDSYQVWLGGSASLTRVAYTYRNRVKYADMDSTIEPLLAMWRDQKTVKKNCTNHFRFLSSHNHSFIVL